MSAVSPLSLEQQVAVERSLEERLSSILRPSSGIFTNSAGVSVEAPSTFNSVSGNMYTTVVGGSTAQTPRNPAKLDYPSHLYSRLLLLKGRGFPLWDPEPPGGLPDEYRVEGASIGDVGIIHPEGFFDFLFNIYHLADDPINGGRVPSGFSPLVLSNDPRDFYNRPGYLRPGSYESTTSIGILESQRVAGEYHFRCSRDEGAILVLPRQVSRQDLRNFRDLTTYAGKHGASWYAFATDDLGRNAPNGSIHLITGVDKTSMWGTASYSGTPEQFNMRFEEGEWSHPGRASVMDGPRGSQPESQLLPNQTTFIRGFTITLRERIWKKLTKKVLITTLGDLGAVEGHPAQSRSSQASTTSGTIAGISKWGGWARQLSNYTLDSELSSEAEVEADVELTRISEESLEDIDPSNHINLYLLSLHPEADVAVTHDLTWSTLIMERETTTDLWEREIREEYRENEREGLHFVTRLMNKSHIWIDSGGTITLRTPWLNDETMQREEDLFEGQGRSFSSSLAMARRIQVLPEERPTRSLHPDTSGKSSYLSRATPQSSLDVPRSELASAAGASTVRTWGRSTGSEVSSPQAHKDKVTSVAFSPDGSRLASGTVDSTVRLWDGKRGSYISTLRGHKNDVTSVAFSPDGSKLASGSNDNTVRLWDGKTGSHISTLEGHSDWVTSVAFSADGSRLASGSDDTTVRLWDGTTSLHIATLKGHGNRVTSVAFSRDGSGLASGSYDNTVRLWGGKTGSPIATLSGHGGIVRSVAFSPDRSRLASGSDDNTVRLWSGQRGSYISTLRGHSNWVTSVAFSPDGSKLASGSYDNTVRLWNGMTGSHLCTLEGHTDWVRSVAFSPDGTKLASGSYDKTVRLWDGKTGSHISTLQTNRNLDTSVSSPHQGIYLVRR